MSTISGFHERMQQEMERIAPSGIHPNVIADCYRGYGAWMGGSILASLSSFPYMWISKEEYEETGASIVNMKCFI